jgi:hypothetical protein
MDQNDLFNLYPDLLTERSKKPPKWINTKRIINNNIKFHNSCPDDFNTYKIDNIVFDEKKKLVCLFKDSLLWNEPTELLRRYYLFT